jgi:hypothetical protein
MSHLSNPPWRPGRSRWWHPIYLSSALAVLALRACGAPGEVVDPDSPPPNDPPCSCETGARRCIGKSVQVCEQESASCSSWGSLVACPSGRCEAGACKGDCQDSCPAGLSRCGADGSRDVCRIGASGCLEWVRSDCASGQYCDRDESQCKPAQSCDATCPKGYSCRPTGVCGGGMAQDLVLDVTPDSALQVRVAGRITLNGAAPKNGRDCSATTNPSSTKAFVRFTNQRTGNTTEVALLCKDTHYDWTTQLVPGAYTVSVQGVDGPDTTSLPEQSYVADPKLVITTDLAGKVLDLRTLTASGRITLNGAAPRSTSLCSSTMNPGYTKAEVQLVEKTHGYTFEAYVLCRDAGYAWNTTVYPGTYTVRVRGISLGFSNLPEQSYVADAGLALTTDLANKVLDVRTVSAGGRITLNGAAPRNTSQCSATMNPGETKAEVQLVEKTHGYTFEAPLLCINAHFQWSATLYPGTYSVRVRGTSLVLSDLPEQSYVADGNFTVTSDVSDKQLDLRTLAASGRITLNGAMPRNTSMCSATRNPGARKVELEFTEKNHGYRFETQLFCVDSSYAWTTLLYPGTYTVRVRGQSDTLTNLPEQSYVADPSLVVTGEISGKVFDVRALTASGRITLNGALPKSTSDCSASTNPSATMAEVSFYEKTYGYRFEARLRCRDTGYAWTTPIFPGIYAVRVRGLSEDLSELPTQEYVTDSSLIVSADLSNKALDLRLIPVSGRVTLLGMPPKNGPLCSKSENPSAAKARVVLQETRLGYRFEAAMLCREDGYGFATTVYPGTYSATVLGSEPDLTNLPDGDSLVVPRLQIP